MKAYLRSVLHQEKTGESTLPISISTPNSPLRSKSPSPSPSQSHLLQNPHPPTFNEKSQMPSPPPFPPPYPLPNLLPPKLTIPPIDPSPPLPHADRILSLGAVELGFLGANGGAEFGGWGPLDDELGGAEGVPDRGGVAVHSEVGARREGGRG